MINNPFKRGNMVAPSIGANVGSSDGLELAKVITTGLQAYSKYNQIEAQNKEQEVAELKYKDRLEKQKIEEEKTLRKMKAINRINALQLNEDWEKLTYAEKANRIANDKELSALTNGDDKIVFGVKKLIESSIVDYKHKDFVANEKINLDNSKTEATKIYKSIKDIKSITEEEFENKIKSIKNILVKNSLRKKFYTDRAKQAQSKATKQANILTKFYKNVSFKESELPFYSAKLLKEKIEEYAVKNNLQKEDKTYLLNKLYYKRRASEISKELNKNTAQLTTETKKAIMLEDNYKYIEYKQDLMTLESEMVTLSSDEFYDRLEVINNRYDDLGIHTYEYKNKFANLDITKTRIINKFKHIEIKKNFVDTVKNKINTTDDISIIENAIQFGSGEFTNDKAKKYVIDTLLDKLAGELETFEDKKNFYSMTTTKAKEKYQFLKLSSDKTKKILSELKYTDIIDNIKNNKVDIKNILQDENIKASKLIDRAMLTDNIQVAIELANRTNTDIKEVEVLQKDLNTAINNEEKESLSKILLKIKAFKDLGYKNIKVGETTNTAMSMLDLGLITKDDIADKILVAKQIKLNKEEKSSISNTLKSISTPNFFGSEEDKKRLLSVSNAIGLSKLKNIIDFEYKNQNGDISAGDTTKDVVKNVYNKLYRGENIPVGLIGKYVTKKGILSKINNHKDIFSSDIEEVTDMIYINGKWKIRTKDSKTYILGDTIQLKRLMELKD